MNQPDACIVRITKAQGNTLGTGFLISTDGQIATCYHVVEGTDPLVAFPGSEPRPAQVVATDPVHDVVILQLKDELPPGAKPARLGHSAAGHYSDFRSRGYRPLGEMQGIPAEGRVLHAVSECSGAQHMPLILKSPDIRKGMSGAPVYIPEIDLVVGMITGYWDSLKAETGLRDAETGFAVPSEAIVTLCSSVCFWDLHQSSFATPHALLENDFISADLGNPHRIKSDFLHWPECTLMIWVLVPERGQGLRNAPTWRYLLAHSTGQGPAAEGHQTWRFYNLFAVRYSSQHNKWVLVYSNSEAKQGFLAIDDKIGTGWHQFLVAWNRSRLVFHIARQGDRYETPCICKKQSGDIYLMHWPDFGRREVFLGAWMPVRSDEVPYEASYCNTQLFQLWLVPQFLDSEHQIVTQHLNLQLPAPAGAWITGASEKGR